MRKLAVLTPLVVALFFCFTGFAQPTRASGAATAAAEGPSPQALASGADAARRHQRQVSDRRVWTLIDYDLPFPAVRLWVLDAQHDNAVLTSTRVSHAWNSGLLFATRFSNEHGSNLSSVGSYVTLPHTYEGKFGHSLRVRGLDRGINDRALERAIIFHPDMNLTHSLGCFMLPMSESRSIIDRIVGGTFVYVHRSDS